MACRPARASRPRSDCCRDTTLPPRGIAALSSPARKLCLSGHSNPAPLTGSQALLDCAIRFAPCAWMKMVMIEA